MLCARRIGHRHSSALIESHVRDYCRTVHSYTYQRRTVKSNRAKHMDRQSFRKLFNYVHVFGAQTLNSCRSAQIKAQRQSKHTAIHSFIQPSEIEVNG